MPFCCECGKQITDGIYKYSMDKFDRPLCIEHQRMEQVKEQPNPEKLQEPESENQIEEEVIEEEIVAETNKGWASKLKKGAVIVGKGIVKGTKKLVDASKKTIQIRKWKDDILRRMTMNQLKRLCFEKRVSTKKSELKESRSGDFYWKEYNCSKGDLVSRLKNKVVLDDIIDFARRNHIKIWDILDDIKKKKDEWKIKEFNERMEKEGRTFIKELEKSILEFNPPRKYYREEILYQDTLATYLREKFPDEDVRVEYARGSSRPDIVVGGVAIEIKGPTVDRDLVSIADKCMRYSQHFSKNMICVLFSVHVSPGRYDEWLKGMNYKNPEVIVIRKE